MCVFTYFTLQFIIDSLNGKNYITLQESEILHATAREIHTGDEDESSSEKHDSFVEEHPTILHTQTRKDIQEQFVQKERNIEIILKDNITVNVYDNTYLHLIYIS